MAKILIGRRGPFYQPFLFRAGCQVADAAGDCVRVDGAAIGGVSQVRRADISSILGLPAIGIIVSKLSVTTCLVAHFGGVVSAGLTPGDRYFVGSNGRPTNVRPAAPAFIQIIGIAVNESLLLLNPSPNLTKVI